MDERLEKALEFSNYRMTIENQKKNLKISTAGTANQAGSGLNIGV